MENKNKGSKDALPEEFSTLKEAGEFWDTHSTADYEEIFEPVAVEITVPPRHGKKIMLAADLAEKLGEVGLKINR